MIRSLGQLDLSLVMNEKKRGVVNITVIMSDDDDEKMERDKTKLTPSTNLSSTSSSVNLIAELKEQGKEKPVPPLKNITDAAATPTANPLSAHCQVFCSVDSCSNQTIVGGRELLHMITSSEKSWFNNNKNETITKTLEIIPFVPISNLISWDEKTGTKPYCRYESYMEPPHFLQTILRCFSYWRETAALPQNNDSTPVLVLAKKQYNPLWPERYRRNRRESLRFNHGILDQLEQTIGLKILPSQVIGRRKKQNYVIEFPGRVPQGDRGNGDTTPPYQMRSAEDANAFRDMFVGNNTNNSTVLDGTNSANSTGTTSTREKKLRIGILNRAEFSRTIWNIDDVQQIVQDAFPQQDVVATKYFENSSFSDQVEYYHGMDLIVSPHGAQLMGMAFMKPCSAVLELTPHGLGTGTVTSYYGSLAKVFGLVHAEWHVSDEENPNSVFNMNYFLHNRYNNLCPSPQKVVVALTELVKRRQNCLENTMQRVA